MKMDAATFTVENHLHFKRGRLLFVSDPCGDIAVAVCHPEYHGA